MTASGSLPGSDSAIPMLMVTCTCFTGPLGRRGRLGFLLGRSFPRRIMWELSTASRTLERKGKACLTLLLGKMMENSSPP